MKLSHEILKYGCEDESEDEVNSEFIEIDKQNVVGNAFAIPNKAKVFENNKEYVVVYKNDCTMEIRKITTIGQNEEFTFVEEKFAPNEKVIARNALMIYEELNK